MTALLASLWALFRPNRKEVVLLAIIVLYGVDVIYTNVFVLLASNKLY